MTDKIELLENEVAVLKNEIRQVLLDIRDNLLTNYQNPFSHIDLSSLARTEDAPKVQHVTVGQLAGPGQGAAQQEPPVSPAQVEGQGQVNVYADLAAVAALSRWLGSGVHKVGKQRMEAVVEIYAMLGGLSPSLKDVLCRLLSLDDGEGLALRDCIATLVELDSLMWRTRAGEQIAPASPAQPGRRGKVAARQTAPAQPEGHGQDTARPAQSALTSQSAAAEGAGGGDAAILSFLNGKGESVG
jgi:hypothetical protein